MKHIFPTLIFLLLAFAPTFAQQPAPLTDRDYVRVDADPAKGFFYPYYFYVPSELSNPEARNKVHTFFVAPNNSGRTSDDFSVHDNDARRRMTMSGAIGSILKVGVLIPAFPRPRSDWKIYTHALDRDSMLTDKRGYARLDLQLIAMIDDARERLAKQGTKFDKRVFINGFSAQGMFANRFTFLHPDRVKAAAIGSPGGWPIAPVATYKEKKLRYPIGIDDFSQVSGHKLDLKDLRKVPLFVFMGDADDNDSVPFDDSYDEVDRELIFPLFGKTPVERWSISQQLYKDAGLKAEFKLYPGVKHTVNEEMRNDIRAFFLKHLN
jgi:dienelactone hydrolase